MPNLTSSEILALADIDPEFDELNKSFQYPRFDFSDPGKVLKTFRAFADQNNNPPPDPDVGECTLTFKARDGFELRLVVSKPSSATKGLPLMVYYHGGGGTIGSPENLKLHARKIVKDLGVVVVAPQYRLAPENPWPTGHDDAWDALRYIAGSPSSFGADLSQGFVVGGVSNGGTVTGVLSHRARDEGLPHPITGLYYAAASFVTPASIPDKYRNQYLARSQDACLDAPLLDRKSKKFFDNAMRYDPHSPYFASLLWPTGHGSMPRTYFQACGMDINRDDALIYERVLREEYGSETRIDVYEGLPHCFWGLYTTLKASRRWERDTLAGLRWLFRSGEGVRL